MSAWGIFPLEPNSRLHVQGPEPATALNSEQSFRIIMVTLYVLFKAFSHLQGTHGMNTITRRDLVLISEDQYELA
jgi:hypothetical protein